MLLRVLLFLSLTQAALGQGPSLSAELLPERATVAPGSTVDLAIRLKVEDDWHIYHPIILDTGFATEVHWTLPAGVTVGQVRYPVPYLGSTPVGDVIDEYLELSGEFVLLATATIADDVSAGSALEIAAEVTALACKQSCIPVDATATLTLPVATEPGPKQKPDFFDDARAELTPLLGEAEYIKGSAVTVQPSLVGRNEPGLLVATIKVLDKHHVQDRDPGVEGLIPTRLLVEQVDGVEFAEEEAQRWTTPHVKDVPGFGRVREQSGTFTIKVPFKVTDEDLPAGPIPVRVLLQYQCCSETGQCYPPMMAAATAVIDYDPARQPEPGALAGAETDEPAEPQVAGRKPADGPARGMATLFVFAFLGGIILNVMPCVLPVISLKIMGFIHQSQEDRGRIFRMGLVYTLGILASFLPLAIVMARAGAVWGSQMQEPGFLIPLSVFVFAFGLSLLGVFEIQLPGSAMSAAGEAAQREGYGGAFMNGLLTTALATPCTAPLLGPAAGLLTQFPPLTQFFGIMLVGAGLAFPYVLLSAFPQWLRYLPKPGAWMVTFKEIVGFVMFAVVVWLLSALVKQVDTWVFLGTLGLLVAVGMACWQIGRLKLTDSTGRHVRGWATALVLLVVVGWGSFKFFEPKGEIPWQDWEPGLPARLASEGYTVYVDYTADWCFTCQWNKRQVVETDVIRARFSDLNVVPIKADFTRRDAVMLKEIRSYYRNGIPANGVPLNIVLPAGQPGEAIVLPETLTQRLVLDALQQAGKSARRPDLVAASAARD